MSEAKHILLVDASGFAYRAFHTSSAGHRESDGEPIGAVLGFIEMVWKLRGAAEADPPTHGVAVFDHPSKNFRHKISPQYKANRPAARRTELAKQLIVMRSVAKVLGLEPLEKRGYEADDLICTLATRARKAGIRTTICSSDKDFAQCVEDGWVEIVDPLQKRRILSADVEKKMGVLPSQVAEVQALAGDPVDNIIGIPGLGLERAAGLIRRFETLEGVLENRNSARWPSVRLALKKHADRARMNLKLTTLKRDVPIAVDFDAILIKPVQRADIEAMGKALGAPNRVAAIFDVERKTHRSVQAIDDPYLWWREELAAPGQRLPDEPQAGYYQRRLVKGGPFVPARIWRERETDFMGKETGREVLRCEVGGQARDANSEWSRLAMNPISEATYRYEHADAAHAKRYRPGDPKANPTERPDILKMPARHNPRGK